MAQAEHRAWSQTQEQRASLRRLVASSMYAGIYWCFHKKWRGKGFTEEDAHDVAGLIEDTAYRSSVAKSLTTAKPHLIIANEYSRYKCQPLQLPGTLSAARPTPRFTAAPARGMTREGVPRAGWSRRTPSALSSLEVESLSIWMQHESSARRRGEQRSSG